MDNTSAAQARNFFSFEIVPLMHNLTHCEKIHPQARNSEMPRLRRDARRRGGTSKYTVGPPSPPPPPTAPIPSPCDMQLREETRHHAAADTILSVPLFAAVAAEPCRPDRASCTAEA